MKKEKRMEGEFGAIGLTVVAALMLISVASVLPRLLHAQINTPTLQSPSSQGGLTPVEAPCVPFYIGVGTGTNQTSVRNTGPGYLNWIVGSTATPNGANYIILHDTSATSVGVGNTRLLPFIFLSTTSNSPGNPVYIFNPPLRFSNGLNVQVNQVTDAVTVCTRLYGTQVP